MAFTTFKAAGALALLSTLVSSAPTSAPIYPPKTDGQYFTLVANVTAGDLTPSINSFVVDSYHVGAGEDYAVLVANTTDGGDAGRVFYVNGTANDVHYGTSNLLTNGGTPSVPYGVSINVANATGFQTVSIDGGIGEAGVGLTQFPDPISELYFGSYANGWYACNNGLASGYAVQLFFKTEGTVTPAGCADITLLPQCGEAAAESADGTLINCYPNVASIDWSYYATEAY